MKISKYTLSVIVLSGLIFCSCKSKKATNRELFETYYEVNVKAFMSTMPDVDTILSRRMGEAVLDKAYEIDSNFVSLDGKQREVFMNTHKPVFENIVDSISRL